MAQSDEVIEVKADILNNPSLPTPLVDTMNIASRVDDLCLLRFYSLLPEGVCEQSRFLVKSEQLKNIVDAICGQIGYYPEKPRKKKSPSKKKKKG